jgi:hypothetical protein
MGFAATAGHTPAMGVRTRGLDIAINARRIGRRRPDERVEYGNAASGLGSVRSVSGPTRLRVVSLLPDGPRQGTDRTIDCHCETMKMKTTMIAAATRQRAMNRSSRAVKSRSAIGAPSRKTLRQGRIPPAGVA